MTDHDFFFGVLKQVLVVLSVMMIAGGSTMVYIFDFGAEWSGPLEDEERAAKPVVVRTEHDFSVSGDQHDLLQARAWASGFAGEELDDVRNIEVYRDEVQGYTIMRVHGLAIVDGSDGKQVVSKVVEKRLFDQDLRR